MKKQTKIKILGIVIWLVLTLCVCNYIGMGLSMANTLINIFTVIGSLLWVFITIDTQCFTKFPKSIFK